MPVQRLSKSFKDISASFQVNPLTDDLIAITNETAIARSLRNLVFTDLGDVPFNPAVGSKVNELLFSPLDDLTATAIRSQLKNTINQFEPRVKLNEVIVEPNEMDNIFDVRLQYDIVGVDVPEQQLEFVLEPTR